MPVCLQKLPCYEVLFCITFGIDVLTAVPVNKYILWNKTPCNRMKVNRRFGGTYRLHIQHRSVCCQLHANFLPGLLFDPEDGGDKLFRNVG
jgi:hypothetical protein